MLETKRWDDEVTQSERYPPSGRKNMQTETWQPCERKNRQRKALPKKDLCTHAL